jgi:hypothetical protein
MATLTVGPGEEYSSLAAAVAAAQSGGDIQNGDTILVNAGTYTNDFPEPIIDNMTIEGVGGLASFIATEAPPNEQGILEIGQPGAVGPTVVLDGLEFSGATISAIEGGNAAGVRYKSGTLTIDNSYFHNNQDGLLADSDTTGIITITNSEFADNGTTNGLTHNIYVTEIGTFDITDSYITAANTGNEIQSRALVNNIIDNRIVDGPTATASYAISLPDGGADTVTGNQIEKGPNSENDIFINFGAAGTAYPGSSLIVSNNTIINDQGKGGNVALHNFVNAPTLDFTGNSVFGLTSSQLAGGPVAVSGTDFLASEPAISEAPPFTICFCAGTRIATPGGDVPVERRAAGDLVLTRTGAARPIVWIGSGRVLATPGRRSAATPVIVRRGALGHNMPRHNLRLTKGHSLFLDEVLIPLEYLVNHRTILWDDHAKEVTIYHIELESHDVLLAEGAPTESYRDDGNRWLFQNANSGWGPPPKPPCAPVMTGGPIVDAVWQRLLDRARPRRTVPLTDDPDLHLLIDGTRVDAMERREGMHVFRLWPRPRMVRVQSRAAVPQELGIARDSRSLGVAVRRIVLTGSRRTWAIEADAPALADGYHAFEPDNGIRWTDGDAAVPAALFVAMDSPCVLMLHLGGSTQYLDDGRTVGVA